MNETKTTFRELFASARSTLPYLVEKAIIGFTEQVVCRMQMTDLSRTELASKLSTSPAYITKILCGGTNFTLESMVKVADALDSELKVELVPKVSAKSWMLVMSKMVPQQKVESRAWASQQLRDRTNENTLFVGPLFPPQLFNDVY